jgi:hypothetical protein
VRVSGVRGSAPPSALKVCVNELGGFRNQLEFVLTGLDVEAKADWLRAQLEARLDPRPAVVDWTLSGRPVVDAASEEEASCLLRCTVQDPSGDAVGRAFSGVGVELALASYPGFTLTAPPARESPYGIYRPAYVPRDVVEEVVVFDDGRREVVV